MGLSSSSYCGTERRCSVCVADRFGSTRATAPNNIVCNHFDNGFQYFVGLDVQSIRGG